MKVLMLGWEFPPHISGGLGTACAGITKALAQQNVNVLFVVPRLHGDEISDKTTLINASEIPVRRRKIEIITKVPPVPTGAERKSVNELQHSVTGSEVVEIPSLLSPYQSVSDPPTYRLEQWNYTFAVPESQKQPFTPWTQLPAKIKVRYEKEPFRFSGTYGSNLLLEVERYAKVVAEFARRNSFDIIHAHDWMTFEAGLAAKRISGKPLILHVHATEVDRSGTNVNPVVFKKEKEGMLLADRIVAVSQWTKDIIVDRYNIPEKKVVVIHNGIDARRPPEVKQPSPLSDSHVVTFLGRITHQKGPMHFVEAARKVLLRFPETQFVVAGSGDQLPMMIERIAQLRLSTHFHFTGFLKGDDIDRVWAMSQVYVMPSVSEPFGIAPLEAIQAGVPVILSRQTGVGEVMPHAIKVDFWNSDAIAEAICSVLQFRSLANTLKANSAEAIKGLTWDKAATKLITLYHDMCAQRQTQKEYDIVLPGTPTLKTSESEVSRHRLQSSILRR